MSSRPPADAIDPPSIAEVSEANPLKPDILSVVENPELIPVRESTVENGLRVNHVEVLDGYEDDPNRETVQTLFIGGEEYLRAHPEITIDSPENVYRDALKAFSGVAAWLKLMPSAKALYPLQRPDIKELPDEQHTVVDAGSRELFRHSPDAVGIRNRAKVMEWLSVQQAQATPDREMQWVSLACGAAVPVLDALHTINQEVPDKDVKLTLVDYDQGALDFAKELADEQGLEEGTNYGLENANLVKELVFSDSFVQRHGENLYDMVDMLGIFEYFDEKRAALLLQNAYKLVKPGGKMVIGNMLDTHPNLNMNQTAIGWPGIKPRSIEEISSILTEAGISTEDCETYIPQDGVYAVVAIEKRLTNAQSPGERKLAAGTLSTIQGSIGQKSA